MALSSEFIRTPIFDRILTTITASITDFSTRTSSLPLYATIEPTISNTSAAKDNSEPLTAYLTDLMNTTMAKYRKYPIQLSFTADYHKPGRVGELDAATVLRYHYKLDARDRAKMTADDPRLVNWAKGVICACVLGWRGRRQAKQLITRNDVLPLTEMHLRRCQRAVVYARKEQGIPAVNVQTGQAIITDKKKVISSLINTPKTSGVASAPVDTGVNLQLVRDNRSILKAILKEFNTQFEKQFHREPSRAEKETLRPLYVEYKTLKVFIPDDDDDEKVSKPNTREKRALGTAGSAKASNTESESAILTKVAQVRATVDEAYKLLQRSVPTDQARLKQFKREIQKCLFELKEQYETTHTEVNAYKARVGKYPGDLTSKWPQSCVDTYHTLYSAYERIKKKLEG